MSALSYQDLPSVIGDKQWECCGARLQNSGYHEFQIGPSDVYVVQPRPKRNLLGLLLSPFLKNNLRVIRGSETRGYVRLWSRVEHLAFDMSVSLVRTRRFDVIPLTFTLSGSSDMRYRYTAYVEAEIVDPVRFFTATLRKNEPPIDDSVRGLLSRYLTCLHSRGVNIEQMIDGGELKDSPRLAEVGYHIKDFTLKFLSVTCLS